MDREERRLKRQQDTKSAAIVMAVLAVILIVVIVAAVFCAHHFLGMGHRRNRSRRLSNCRTEQKASVCQRRRPRRQ